MLSVRSCVGLAYADGVWVAGAAETSSEAPYYTTGPPTGTWTASNANSSSEAVGVGNGIFTASFRQHQYSRQYDRNHGNL